MSTEQLQNDLLILPPVVYDNFYKIDEVYNIYTAAAGIRTYKSEPLQSQEYVPVHTVILRPVDEKKLTHIVQILLHGFAYNENNEPVVVSQDPEQLGYEEGYLVFTNRYGHTLFKRGVIGDNLYADFLAELIAKESGNGIGAASYDAVKRILQRHPSILDIIKLLLVVDAIVSAIRRRG